MLTVEMTALIEAHRAGMVASVNPDGTPAVSPKATFVVLDNKTLAYGNIRSPGTSANIRRLPDVEVCFIDVLRRQAVRVKGQARMIAKAQAPSALRAAFTRDWADYLDVMTSFVVIDLSAAELILSPAYDLGHRADDLARDNLAKLSALHPG